MDRREIAQHYHLFESVDEKTMTGEILLFNEEIGEEESTTVKMKFSICPTCNGKGTHVNPSIDSQGISSDEFAEDPDFFESYISGDYDVNCYECGGKRVIPVVDEDNNPPDLVQAIQKAEQSAYEAARERIREREMGY